MTTLTLDRPIIQKKDLWVPDELDDALRNWQPKTDLGLFVRKAAELLPDRSMALELIERFQKVAILHSALYLKVFRVDGSLEDYGMVGDKSITTVGAGYLVDAWQNAVEIENQKHHGLGTGSTAENVADSALVTELTTEYTGNIRATGTTTEASATVFRTVGSNLDGTPGAALREHGIFSATSGGVLWDRTVYSAITLSSGDTLESTYDLTISTGG